MHQSGIVMFQRNEVTKELDVCGAAGGKWQVAERHGSGDAFQQGAFVNANVFDPFSTDTSKHIAVIMSKSPDIVQLTLYR
jgi:hypothetical protein